MSGYGIVQEPIEDVGALECVVGTGQQSQI